MRGTKLSAARLTLAFSLLLSLLSFGFMQPAHGQNYKQKSGYNCVIGYNNADYEKDFFWAATGHFHGNWYKAWGEHCHRVRVNIYAVGYWCSGNMGGPGPQVATRTELDGYVTTYVYLSPNQRYYPSSEHVGTTPSWRNDFVRICYGRIGA
jgi:hypothetical protein